MNVLTKTEFATAHGVSRSAITQAVKRGALAETPQGKINLHHPTTVEWARIHTPKGNLEAIYTAVKVGKKFKEVADNAKKATKAVGAEKRAAEIAVRQSEKKRVKAAKETEALRAELDENTAAGESVFNALSGGDGIPLPPLEDIDPKDIWRYPKASLDKLRIFEVARKTQQDREQKRGDLIPRELVTSLFSKLHAVDSNEWRTLEERLIPTLCSVAGFADDDPRVLKIQKAINKETTHILRHTQRLIDTFLATHAE